MVRAKKTRYEMKCAQRIKLIEKEKRMEKDKERGDDEDRRHYHLKKQFDGEINTLIISALSAEPRGE
jgi:hypothetical protein